jgi:hypothetical protein
VPSEPRYAVRWVLLLPNPPDLVKSCMTDPLPWWRRLGQQLFPRRGGRDCCEVHQADWHKASKIAIRYLRDAGRAGIDPTYCPGGDDTYDYIMNRAASDRLGGSEHRAVKSLFLGPIDVVRCGRARWDYMNGQHRARAMLDQGVHRTVVITQ